MNGQTTEHKIGCVADMAVAEPRKVVSLLLSARGIQESSWRESIANILGVHYTTAKRLLHNQSKFELWQLSLIAEHFGTTVSAMLESDPQDDVFGADIHPAQLRVGQDTGNSVGGECRFVNAKDRQGSDPALVACLDQDWFIDNICFFHLITLAIFEKLYSSFPTPVDLDANAFALTMIPERVKRDETWNSQQAAQEAIEFIEQEGFLTHKGTSLEGGTFLKARLTLKGLEILGSTPNSPQDRKPLINRIRKLFAGGAKQASPEAAKQLAQQVLAAAGTCALRCNLATNSAG